MLGKYVRDEKLLTLEEAIRKMTSRPAARVGLRDRGLLRPGMAADVVVFDPATIHDVATFEDPNHYSVGVKAVLRQRPRASCRTGASRRAAGSSAAGSRVSRALRCARAEVTVTTVALRAKELRSSRTFDANRAFPIKLQALKTYRPRLAAAWHSLCH